MKAPVFAYGTMDALVKAIEKGKIKYPAYVWLKDTLQYAFVNKELGIEVVGLPKLTGTLDNQIVLSELDGGVYEVKGQYQVVDGAETVFLSASYIIVIVRHRDNETKVRIITADNIFDFTVVNGEIVETDQNVTVKYLTEHEYVTETQVDDKIAAMAITLEQERLKNLEASKDIVVLNDRSENHIVEGKKLEIKDYVDSIIQQQIEELLPEEVDKLFSPVDENDVRKLFEDVPSI